jgi:cytochrome c-type biogenesis protein CcmH
MSERARDLVAVVVMAALAAVIAVLVLSAPNSGDRVARLGASIRCPVCQGESIADSPAAMARDMMTMIEERVAAGVPDEEILEELLSSYSGAVLLDPPVGGSTLLLWLAPALALIAGIAMIYWWRRRPSPSESSPTPPEPPIGRRRAVGAALMIAAAAVVVVVAGSYLQDRGGPAQGVAAVDVDQLDEVSNETMEAFITANADDPQIAGMRLALAERYFEEGDYRAAFPHYLAVADSPQATDGQVVVALVGLGWMAWDGNGEAEAAIGLFDQALDIDPDSITARYLKGRVLWCGTGSPQEAGDLMASLLDEDLADESRALIHADLDSIESGESCR